MIMTWNVATQFPWVLFQIISLGWFRYKHICKFVEFFNEKVTIVILFSIVSCLCKTQTIILSMKSFFVLYIDSHIAYSQSSSFTIDCLQLRTWCLLLHTLWRIHLSFSIPLSFTGRPSSTSLPSDKKSCHWYKTSLVASPFPIHLPLSVKLPVPQVFETLILLTLRGCGQPEQLKQHIASFSRGSKWGRGGDRLFLLNQIHSIFLSLSFTMSIKNAVAEQKRTFTLCSPIILRDFHIYSNCPTTKSHISPLSLIQYFFKFYINPLNITTTPFIYLFFTSKQDFKFQISTSSKPTSLPDQSLLRISSDQHFT